MKQAPLRGLRCLPRDSVGTRSGRSAEALRTWTPRETSVVLPSLHPSGGRLTTAVRRARADGAD